MKLGGGGAPVLGNKTALLLLSFLLYYETFQQTLQSKDETTLRLPNQPIHEVVAPPTTTLQKELT